MDNKKIKAEEEIKDQSNSNFPILGTYEGECADANITNNNGLDIDQEVWEHVFNSDDYKQGIDKGWFIGYLGHPEDPGCMEFKDACIVMTEGHIDNNGKVYGKFNLIDTPVGRIVKTFQDAGVTFGISVRGAGDIVNNSVEPESFVFRGFDLVSFPAYPESIPTFKEIAASTDIEQKKKFDKICASVKCELENIESTETLDVIQSQFPEQSEMYNEIENRKSEIDSDIEISLEDRVELLESQVRGLIDLYIDTVEEKDCIENQLCELNRGYTRDKINMSRKLHVMTRICASQDNDVKELEEMYGAESLKLENRNKVLASTNNKLKSQIASLETRIQKESSSNLDYVKKINSYKQELKHKEDVICSLKDEIDKTVVNASKATNKVSNLEAENESLLQKVEASEKVIEEYQDAYASLYSQILGVNLGNNVAVTSATTVSELQDTIVASSSINSIADSFNTRQTIDLDDEEDLVVC